MVQEGISIDDAGNNVSVQGRGPESTSIVRRREWIRDGNSRRQCISVVIESWGRYVLPHLRMALVMQANGEHRRAYVLVNNCGERNAPLTVQTLVRALQVENPSVNHQEPR